MKVCNKFIVRDNRWESEKDFANWFLAREKKHGNMPVRLESRATRTGIPDAVVITHNGCNWYEFKFLPKASINDKKWKILWRPGQKAFALQYLMASKNNDWVTTVVGMEDGYLVIPMLANICNRTNNIIYQEEAINYGED